MTDIIETHGSQEPTAQTVGRRPWKAPCLIDLDDEQTNSGACMMAGNKLTNYTVENTDHDGCYFEAPGMAQVAYS